MKSRKVFNLRSSLLLIFSMNAICFIIAAVISISTVRRLTKQFDLIGSVYSPRIATLVKMRVKANSTKFLILQTAVQKSQSVLGSGVATQLSTISTEYDELNKKLSEFKLDKSEQEELDLINKAWQGLMTSAKKIIGLSQSNLLPERREFYHLVLTSFLNQYDHYFKTIGALIELEQSNSDRIEKGANSSAHSGNIFTVIFSALCLVLSTLLGGLSALRLTRQFQSLTAQLNSKIKILEGVSQEISAANTNLSESSTEQASALQETAASISQVSAMVSKNAENAKNSKDHSSQNKQTATEGKNAVEEMIVSMKDIDESNSLIMKQIEESNSRISEIVQLIGEIGSKTKVINDIVFQTKLLSFNASVEAARAGEHGKGFAVVAEEVGNLAQMSGNASKEITLMLSDSISKVEQIVSETRGKVEHLIQSGKQKVQTGTSTAEKCRTVLDKILNNIGSLDEIVGEISTASQEQAQGVQEISKAIEQLDMTTQQNVKIVQTTEAASHQINTQSRDLRNLIAQLSKIVSNSNQISSSDAVNFSDGEQYFASQNSPKSSSSKSSPTQNFSSTSPGTDSSGGSTQKSHPSERHPQKNSLPRSKTPSSPETSSSSHSNVISLPKKQKSSTAPAPSGASNPSPAQKNVSEGTRIPSAADPRFEDI